MRSRMLKIDPPKLLIISLLSLMGVGTLLLKLPFATTTPISWLDSLFVTTSALTVTGLSTVDPATTFTVFGQVVIMCLIQVGGIGVMSFAVLIFIMLGKKISLQSRIILQQSLNQTSVGGIIRLLRRLFVFALIIEGIATLLLAIVWVPQFGLVKGLYFSLFHAVSAFNNAGFALFSNNLIDFVGNPIVNFVISSLFILGGIGFTVMVDVWKRRSFHKLSLHSRLMIIGTLAMNIIGMLTIFFLEYNNQYTLGPLSTVEQWFAAYFQATSLRTAGFNTIDLANIESATVLVMVLFMFIGAGSGSTGGGIKLTTFLVIFLGVGKFLKGQRNIVIFKKTLRDQIVLKSLAICVISLIFIFASVLVLSITEDTSLRNILFEVVSAFGTVGLTLGLTMKLSAIGKLVITFMMFFGKVGPLTLVFSLAKPDNSKIKYPNEEILTG
ncbi:TrkH family potassium uptake protein [Priestia taiwanensis]|uniref:TrkH family potassium uptake protein n=1 Tax=Priestia taiwanensis TaxID=1347902 RepID=UPI001667535F|nr:TrkH family potassium uptake protein [Priestia taiwanensis]